MGEYDDLSFLFETSRTVLSQIVELNNLPDSSINKSATRDLMSVPFLTLKWQAEDGIARSIHVIVVGKFGEAFVKVEINAWKNIEKRGKESANPRKLRQILSKEITTLRCTKDYDRAKTFQKVSAALCQAYAVAARLDLEDLRSESERLDADGDPGPIKTGWWLAE